MYSGQTPREGTLSCDLSGSMMFESTRTKKMEITALCNLKVSQPYRIFYRQGPFYGVERFWALGQIKTR
jgi:hypothetical protein